MDRGLPTLSPTRPWMQQEEASVALVARRI